MNNNSTAMTANIIQPPHPQNPNTNYNNRVPMSKYANYDDLI
jgi:hypothetical protein